MKLVSLALLAVLVGGCTVARPPEETSADESQLRALSAQEILGTIAYGETKDVDFTPAPRYRAFAFEGTRGDTIEAKVVARDGTDPILWLTDASFNTITLSDNPKPTDTNPLITRTLQKSGTHYLVFREMTFAPRAKLAVTLTKTAAVPAECDGEGIVNPECSTPTGIDPFDTASCTGPALSSAEAAAKLGVAGGVALTDAKIYYRTRQCTAGQCSPWVRAFLMDISLASVASTVPAAPDAYTFTAASTRAKVKVDFALEPGALKQLCVDGPFATLQNTSDWTLFADGTPGVCSAKVVTPAAVTATCARFEVPTITLASTTPSQTTEYGAVLLARY